jgi:hypothetical protein
MIFKNMVNYSIKYWILWNSAIKYWSLERTP